MVLVWKDYSTPKWVVTHRLRSTDRRDYESNLKSKITAQNVFRETEPFPSSRQQYCFKNENDEGLMPSGAAPRIGLLLSLIT